MSNSELLTTIIGYLNMFYNFQSCNSFTLFIRSSLNIAYVNHTATVNDFYLLN